MRWLILSIVAFAACGDSDGSGGDMAPPPDLRVACVKNADCPSGQLCVPPYSCPVGDGGARVDVFYASCVATLQGQPCVVDGDHVTCCR